MTIANDNIALAECLASIASTHGCMAQETMLNSGSARTIRLTGILNSRDQSSRKKVMQLTVMPRLARWIRTLSATIFQPLYQR